MMKCFYIRVAEHDAEEVGFSFAVRAQERITPMALWKMVACLVTQAPPPMPPRCVLQPYFLVQCQCLESCYSVTAVCSSLEGFRLRCCGYDLLALWCAGVEDG